MKLTDEDREILTRFLDEEWLDNNSCIHCGKTDNKGFHAHYSNDYDSGKHDFEPQENRAFAASDDVFDLMDKLINKGIWNSFYWWTWDKGGGICGGNSHEARNVAWVFRRTDKDGDPHFAGLVNQFLKTFTCHGCKDKDCKVKYDRYNHNGDCLNK